MLLHKTGLYSMPQPAVRAYRGLRHWAQGKIHDMGVIYKIVINFLFTCWAPLLRLTVLLRCRRAAVDQVSGGPRSSTGATRTAAATNLAFKLSFCV